jgi:CheY-like chemotaxis protein
VTVAAIAEVGEQTNESSNASDMPPLSMQENTTGGTNSGLNVLESDMSARNLFIQTPSRRHSRVHKSSFSVLVVDDSTPILKITKISLERAGHTVDQAFNGRIALDKMKSNFYDVVLMDIQMPIMGGIEAVTRYREYERDQVSRSAASFRQQFRRQLLIIGMSANGDSSVMEEAIRCGMDAFVSKPFSLEAMMKVIDAHSNRRGSQPVSPVGPNSAVSATSDAGNGSRLSCSR